MIDDNITTALVEAGLVTEDQLIIAKESQKTLGGSLEQILIDKGFVTEEQLLNGLASRMNTSFISLAKYKVDPNIVKLLPVTLAKKHRVVPLFKIENKVTVATSNPLNVLGLEDVGRALGANVEAMFALDSDIERAIHDHYRGIGLTEAVSGSKVEIIGSMEDFSDDEATAEKN